MAASTVEAFGLLAYGKLKGPRVDGGTRNGIRLYDTVRSAKAGKRAHGGTIVRVQVHILEEVQE